MDTHSTGEAGPQREPTRSAPEVRTTSAIGEGTRKFLVQILEPGEFDRRAHARLRLEAPIKIEILLPEDTFRPHAFEGKSLDLSIRGMKLFVPNFPELLYRRVQAKTRFARVELNEPELGERFRLTGRIMWYAYQSNRAGNKDGDCMFGVMFSEADTPNLKEYVSFVEDIKRAVRE